MRPNDHPCDFVVRRKRSGELSGGGSTRAAARALAAARPVAAVVAAERRWGDRWAIGHGARGCGGSRRPGGSSRHVRMSTTTARGMGWES